MRRQRPSRRPPGKTSCLVFKSSPLCPRNGEFGSYFITYTGLRAGINLLTIKAPSTAQGILPGSGLLCGVRCT